MCSNLEQGWQPLAPNWNIQLAGLAGADRFTCSGFVTVPQANQASLIQRIPQRAQADPHQASATYEQHLQASQSQSVRLPVSFSPVSPSKASG